MQQNLENRLEILKKGYLVYKKSHKVYVMLCAPVSIADVATVYHSIFPGKGKNILFIFIKILYKF